MLFGLDVGGTHTDAVLLENGHIISSCKIATDHDNLINSITEALEKTVSGIDPSMIRRVNLSTTICTNVIAEGKFEPAAVLVSAGPGIDPSLFRIGDCYHIIDGSIDHRGDVTGLLDMKQLESAVEDCRTRKKAAFALISKFSTRNPSHENIMAEALKPFGEIICLGHEMSDSLGFPRRISTAYFNASVWKKFNLFADAIEESFESYGIDAQLNILKADGGTLPLSLARRFPVEAIFSGPAASVMGIISIADINEDSIMIDIGGSTTDISFFCSGNRIIERDGASIAGHQTLVRAIQSRSIALGGDSEIKIADRKIYAGIRTGPSMADGGTLPTITDAFNFLGISVFGDKKSSIEGIENLARSSGFDPGYISKSVVEYAVSRIKSEVDLLLTEINEKPLYTVHEMIEGKTLSPAKFYPVGGPASAFAPMLEKALGVEAVLSGNHKIANAIGAALAKTTFEIELYADTIRGFMTVPNIGLEREIDSSYSLDDAEKDAVAMLEEFMHSSGVNIDRSDIEITESSLFKMVEGYFSSGRDIRVKCQIRPGVDAYSKKGKAHD